MPRAEVNTDLGGAERLQVSARTAGISAPVSTVNGNGMLALAESLRNVRPELNKYLEEEKSIYKEAETNRAYDTIAGMTYEEAAAKVAAGDMRKTESPWFKAAFEKQFGLATAANRKREIITAYNNEFDKDGGNVDEFLAGYVKSDLEAYGNNEFIAAGLREGMAGVLPTVRDTQAEYKDTQTTAKTVEQFYTIAEEAVSKAVYEDGDVGAAIAGLYAGHKSTLGMTSEQLDGQMITLAEKYANDGDIASLNALLDADPEGRGSFRTRAEFATDAQSLLETAAAVQGKTLRTANVLPIVDLKTRASQGGLDDGDRLQIDTFTESGQFSTTERESLLEENGRARDGRVADTFRSNLESAALSEATTLVTTGQGAMLQDRDVVNPYNGQTVTIKADELVDKVVTERMNAIAEQGADLPNVSAVMAQELSSFAVPSKYKPWETTLSNGHVSLTNALRTQDKDGNVTIPAPAQNAYKLWKELAGTPTIRERHTTDPVAAAIYRDAETLEKNGYMGPEDALITAAKASEGRRDGRTALSTTIDRDKFASEIKGAMSGGWFSSAASNSGVAAMEIERQARLLIDMNIPMDKAVETAAERFETSFTNINGVYVNTRDRLIPGNFEEIARENLADFVVAHPDAEDEDLTLWPSSDQDYWYVSDSLGIPIPGSRPIHISKLQKNPRAYSMEDANKDVEHTQGLPKIKWSPGVPVSKNGEVTTLYNP